MARGLVQSRKKEPKLHQEVPLSEVFDNLGLSEEDLHHLQDIGITSTEEFFGLIYAALEDLANELNITPAHLQAVGRALRRYVDPGTLRKLDDMHRSPARLPLGAELNRPTNAEELSDYEEVRNASATDLDRSREGS